MGLSLVGVIKKLPEVVGSVVSARGGTGRRFGRAAVAVVGALGGHTAGAAVATTTGASEKEGEQGKKREERE